MKKIPTSSKARAGTGWKKHLRKDGKRTANKGTRQAGKGLGREGIYEALGNPTQSAREWIDEPRVGKEEL